MTVQRQTKIRVLEKARQLLIQGRETFICHAIAGAYGLKHYDYLKQNTKEGYAMLLWFLAQKPCKGGRHESFMGCNWTGSDAWWYQQETGARIRFIDALLVDLNKPLYIRIYVKIALVLGKLKSKG